MLNGVMCLFCGKSSRYSCPQCAVRYCSTECYKHEKHATCSEGFYKKQVLEHLKGMSSSSTDKHKMLEQLKRSQQNTSQDGNDGVEEINERLNGVNLNDADELWKCLTFNEKNMFERMIKTGNVPFIRQWNPWWRIDCSTKKPKVLKDIPQFRDIYPRKPPDTCLKFNIAEIILAYVRAMRLYNGDMLDSAGESLETLQSLSKVLFSNRVYSDLETIVYNFVDRCHETVTTCLNDAEIVLSCKQTTLLALSDLYRFTKRSQKRNDEAKGLYKITKKVYFYLAYANDFFQDIHFLTSKLKLIRGNIKQETVVLNQQRSQVEGELATLRPRDKPLIEEI